MKGTRFLTMMALLAVLFGAAGLTAVAEPLPQGSGDGGAADLAPVATPVPENAPDMDGYVGPLFQETGDTGDASSSADGQSDASLDWEQAFPELQLDEETAPITTADGEITWSGFYYVFVAGSTLQPRASTTTWASSGGGGCIYAVADAGMFNVPLDLPQGSRIDYLRLYFYDTSASDSRAWVTIYDGAGGYVDVIGVNSSGTAGYGTTQSAYMGHIVNNSSNAYVLNWRPNVTGSTMMLCGLRVAYRLP